MKKHSFFAILVVMLLFSLGYCVVESYGADTACVSKVSVNSVSTYTNRQYVAAVQAVRAVTGETATIYIYSARDHNNRLVYLGTFTKDSEYNHSYKLVQKTNGGDYMYYIHILGPAWYFNCSKIAY